MTDCFKFSYFSYSYFINIPVCVSNRLLMGQRNSSFSVIRTGAEMILIPFHNAPLPHSNKVFPQKSPFRYDHSLNPIVSLHLILHRIYSLLYQSSSFSFCFHPNNTTLSQTEGRWIWIRPGKPPLGFSFSILARLGAWSHTSPSNNSLDPLLSNYSHFLERQAKHLMFCCCLVPAAIIQFQNSN